MNERIASAPILQVETRMVVELPCSDAGVKMRSSRFWRDLAKIVQEVHRNRLTPLIALLLAARATWLQQTAASENLASAKTRLLHPDTYCPYAPVHQPAPALGSRFPVVAMLRK
jgi:hypothetical protein